jgi:hypothetical protein
MARDANVMLSQAMRADSPKITELAEEMVGGDGLEPPTLSV